MARGYIRSAKSRVSLSLFLRFLKAMTRKLEVCLILLVAVSAVCAQNRHNGTRPSSLASSSNRRPRPQNNRRGPRPFDVDYDYWCQDNNVPHDRWFVHPGWCDWAIACWDDNDGQGVITYFEECTTAGTWYFRDGWLGDVFSCDWPFPDEVCEDHQLTWPLCPAPGSTEVVQHPADSCSQYYICMWAIVLIIYSKY